MSIATEDNPQDYCIVQPQSPEDIKARSRDLKSLKFLNFSRFLTSKCRMKLTILRKYGVGYLMSNRFESLLSF